MSVLMGELSEARSARSSERPRSAEELGGTRERLEAQKG